MMLIAQCIERPFDVAVQRPHDADPRKHSWAAKLRGRDQGFHRSLPLRGLVFGLRQFGDVGAGVLQGYKLLATRQRDRFVECAMPAGI